MCPGHAHPSASAYDGSRRCLRWIDMLHKIQWGQNWWEYTLHPFNHPRGSCFLCSCRLQKLCVDWLCTETQWAWLQNTCQEEEAVGFTTKNTMERMDDCLAMQINSSQCAEYWWKSNSTKSVQASRSKRAVSFMPLVERRQFANPSKTLEAKVHQRAEVRCQRISEFSQLCVRGSWITRL